MAKRRSKVIAARVYDDLPDEHAYRVLVDRLWPRGVKKADLNLDAWAKELAPSAELRRWFGHDPARWDEFRRRYYRELEGRAAAVAELRKAAGDRQLVLLYAARDTEHNHAVALRDWMTR